MAPAITAEVRHDPVSGTYHWHDGSSEGTTASLSEARFYAIERWIRRAVHFHLHHYSDMDRQDALQEGLIALWRVLSDPNEPKHDTAIGATPSWLIQRGVLYAKEYAARATHHQHVSLDAPIETESGEPTRIGLIPAMDTDLSPLYQQTLTLLFACVRNTRHRAVGVLFLAGVKPLEIAERLNWHESGVSRCLQQVIRPVLAAALTEDGCETTLATISTQIRARVEHAHLSAAPSPAVIAQIIEEARAFSERRRQKSRKAPSVPTVCPA
jgi:hypothetical protein